MPKMHLRQPGFTYSACGLFAKSKERIQKLKEHVFNRTWLMEIFKSSARRTASYKILCDKAFNIAKNPKWDGYQIGIPSMVYKFFDKNNSDLLTMSDQQLAEELNKSIIRKFKKRKV